MLGCSLASHGRAAPAPAVEQNAEQSSQVQASSAEVGATDPAIIAPPVAEKESFLMSLLRIILWGGIFYGIYKVVTGLRRSQVNRSAKKPNYTFGNN